MTPTPTPLEQLAIADELKTFLDRSTMNAKAEQFLRKVEKALRLVAASPSGGAVREALKNARAEIVLAISFLGRDQGSDRISGTVDSVIARLVKADQEALAAIDALVPGDGVEPEFPSWTDEDKAYALGRRDGYESAIQDLDLATGGDGEFKGSTIPGETVDVPAMKARIIGRICEAQSYADLRASGGIFPEAYETPGHTDLMVSPESIDAFMEKNPLPAPADDAAVAWIVPGSDIARDDGFIDAMAWRGGEFTKPLYTRPAKAVDVEAIARLIEQNVNYDLENPWRSAATAVLALLTTGNASSETEGGR